MTNSPEYIKLGLMTLFEAIKILKSEHPDLMQLSENQLIAITPEHLKPRAFDNRLRLNFWAQQNQDDAHVGVCTREVFENYIANEFKLAYLLCQPAEYKVKIEEIIDLGLDQMRDILLLKHVDDENIPNTKLIANKLAIFKHLDERKSGLATQKIHVGVTQQITRPNITMISQGNSEADLIKQLAEAQKAEDDILVIPTNAKRVN